MSDNLLALVLERDKEIAALKAENDRLGEEIEVMILGDRLRAERDRLREALVEIVADYGDNHAVADIARAALAKEAGQ